MKKITLVAIVACLVPSIIQPAEARRYYRHLGPYYRSSDHSWVHRPERRGHHGLEVAIFRNGTHSYSHHHRGT